MSRPDNSHLDELNSAQREAVEHGVTPGLERLPSALLVIAGAGSGKTNTLAHRVAHLVLNGADPRRILLLTFTRRAAAEMTQRALRICARAASRSDRHGRALAEARLPWSGTFHSIANRLLRLHAESVGLDPSFTVLDRADSEDQIDWLRGDLGLSEKSRRFPRKSTCVAIYSRVVNAQRPLDEILENAFPWCESWSSELRELFRRFVEMKQQQNVLDYDDLLLYWYHMMNERELAALVAERFDHVLVDEYQDTNALQAAILLALKPDGVGLTVVGDDAQAIYSFRAATVRNILEFPALFEPEARVVTLERNYRSTEPILGACNAVIARAAEGFSKRLVSHRASPEKPSLVAAEDERAQVDYVVERILEHREAGIDLHRQAVLMRATHHSDALEIELGRRQIPYVKYGGLKFLEAGHVKDALCVLRWVENPLDSVAAFRVVQLLPGVGPVHARRTLDRARPCAFDLDRLRACPVPKAAGRHWIDLCTLLARLRDPEVDWRGQMNSVRRWYQPHLERIYEDVGVRQGDLEQLEQIAGEYPSRERFLTELCLDPPSASGDQAGPPHLDEDYLILSTIHSAKGQEWDVVFLLNAADGCIPSDMATSTPEQIEEERRLLYVAMTRARDHLHVVHPHRFFTRQQHRHGDRSVTTPRTRFIASDMLPLFARRAHGRGSDSDPRGRTSSARVDVASRLREMW